MKEQVVLIDHGEEWSHDCGHLERTPDSLTPKPMIEEAPSSTGLIACCHRLHLSLFFAVSSPLPGGVRHPTSELYSIPCHGCTDVFRSTKEEDMTWVTTFAEDEATGRLAEVYAQVLKHPLSGG